MIEEETGEVRPMVLTDAIEAIECTWMRELDGADSDQPGELNGYEGPYHDFNGITSKFGAHFILRVDRILMKKKIQRRYHKRRYRKGFSASACRLRLSRFQEFLVSQKAQNEIRASTGAEGVA